MVKWISIFILLLNTFATYFSYAQKQGLEEADSLISNLPYLKDNKVKAIQFNRIASLYLYINPVRSAEFSKKAITLSESIAFQPGIADGLINLSWAIYFNSNSDTRENAFKQFDSAEKKCNEIGHKKGLGRLFLGKAQFFMNVPDYANSLENVNKALTIFKESGDSADLMQIYALLEKLYFETGEFEKGLEMARIGIHLSEKNKNKTYLHAILNECGNYFFTSETDTAKAMDSYKKALEVSTSLGLNVFTAEVLVNMGKVFAFRREYGAALDCFNRSIDLCGKNEIDYSLGKAIMKTGEVSLSMAMDYKLVSTDDEFSGKDRQYYLHHAIDQCSKAMIILQKQAKLSSVAHCCRIISDALYELGNYKMSLEYMEKAWNVNDSIVSFENQRKLSAVETNLLNSIHHKEIELIRQRNINKRNAIFFLIVILCGVLLAIVLIMRNQRKVQKLLLNILPESIAERLKRKEKPIADFCENVTVVFIDIVNFTSLSAQIHPHDMVNILNKVYTEFDLISSLFGLEKIKTIGDCYLVAAGIPEANPDHAKAAARFAIEAMKRLKNFDTGNGLYLNFRCGIDCGPVMAGVIGEKKFTYDLWGDVVNTAARMEECCEPGKIQVTERFVNEIRNSDEAVGKVKEADSHGNEFIIEERGFCEIKGKGKMKSYYLIS